MTYDEYRAVVVDYIHTQMQDHGWSRDDADHCAMSCWNEFEKGFVPERTARILLAEAARED